MKFYGIASAIHGKDDLYLTTSVVGGDKKDAIRLLSSTKQLLDPTSSISVKDVFQRYLNQLASVVADQRRVLRVPLPVVFGWPYHMDNTALIEHVETQFAQYLRAARFPAVEAVPAPQNTAAKRSQDHLEKISLLIDGFVENTPGLEAHELAFHGKGTAHEPTEALSDSKLTEVNPAWGTQWHKLKEAAKTNRETRQLLETIIRRMARNFARSVLNLQEGLADETRFMMLGAPTTSQEADLMQYCFRDDSSLRQIFGLEVMKVLQINYHVAIKCPLDPSSPPFADVAATHVADTMDIVRYGRVYPEVVMVKHE